MITRDYAILQLDDLIENQYRKDTPQGQQAIEGVKAIKAFVESLDGQPMIEILDNEELSLFELKQLKRAISSRIEDNKKENLHKVLTLKKMVDDFVVEEIHYEANTVEAVKNDTQRILDSLSDDELLKTVIKVEVEMFEEQAISKLTLKGDQ